MIQKLKSTVAVLFIFIIIFIITVSIWFLLPYEKVDSRNLLNKQYFVFLSINLDLRNRDVSDFLYSNFFYDKKISNWQNYLINAAFKVFPSVDILGGLELRTDTKKPNYLILNQNSRLVRLGKIADSIMKFFKVHKKNVFYGFYKGVVIVSNKEELIKKTKQNFTTNICLENKLYSIRRNHHLSVLISNHNNKFAEYVTEMQEKISYQFFPTIFQVESIECYLDTRDKYSLEGRVILSPRKNIDTTEQVNKDLDFLLESIKRALLAQDLKFSFKILSTEDNKIVRSIYLEKIRR